MKKFHFLIWNAEYKKLNEKKISCIKEFYHQKENIHKVEVIQKSVDNCNIFQKKEKI